MREARAACRPLKKHLSGAVLVGLAFFLIAFLAACNGLDEIQSTQDWVFTDLGEPVPSPSRSHTPAPPQSLPSPVPSAQPETSISLSTEAVTSQPPEVLPPGQSLILAHYMAWFRTRAFSGYWQHWQWDPDGDGQYDPGDSLPDLLTDEGLRQIAAVDYPAIGPYDSDNPAVIEYQIASAWAAGIDGFVVDWYGPEDGSNIDPVFAQILAMVSRWQQIYGLGFFVGINYEEKILEPLPAADRAGALFNHLTYVLTEYAHSPAFLTYQGIPVIFYFQAWPDGQAGLLSPAELAQVRRELPPHYLLYMGAETEFLDVADGFFSWVSGANADPLDWGADYANWVYPEMDARTDRHDLALTVGSVWAGFDDSRVWGWGETPRFIDDQNGTVYDQTWDLALAAQAQRGAEHPAWVQIVSWNDWNEGTQIEPSLAGGTDLLAATQDKARHYTGRDMPLAALDLPARILALRRAQPGPETEALVNDVYALLFAGDALGAAALLE